MIITFLQCGILKPPINRELQLHCDYIIQYKLTTTELNPKNQVDDKILELKLSKLNKSKNIEIKPFFEAITSKAFQVAVIIAFETFYSLQAKKRKFKTRDEAAEVYINLLNGISIDQWLFIFTLG